MTVTVSGPAGFGATWFFPASITVWASFDDSTTSAIATIGMAPATAAASSSLDRFGMLFPLFISWTRGVCQSMAIPANRVRAASMSSREPNAFM